MTFGEKLQALRKKAGLSQEDLAEKLEITRQTVSKWELDQSTPELSYIARLADFYQVTTDYLIRDGADEAEHSSEPVTGSEAETDTAEKTDATEGAKEETVIPQETGKASSAPLIALGILLAVFGLVGILTFVVLSTVHPWEYHNWKHVYTGLAGYLLGTKTVPFFVLCVALAVAGVAILVVLSLKAVRPREEKPKKGL